MEVIPVLDLLRGKAVHARGGKRAAYQPVRSVLLPGREGDAVALARAYRTSVGANQCYIADLDAIDGWTPQLKLLGVLADASQGFGTGLMVDAGITTPKAAVQLLEAGASRVVVGLETLKGFIDLQKIVDQVGGSRVVFSLDLLGGKPIRRRTRTVSRDQSLALELGARAAEAGVESIIVLDLAAVGSGAGPQGLEIVAAIKSLVGVQVYAAGGVRSTRDLEELASVGCDAVLVGTAIHEGTLDRP